MTPTARLIGGPSDGERFPLNTNQVVYLEEQPHEPDDQHSRYIYKAVGRDPRTGEYIFEWGEP